MKILQLEDFFDGGARSEADLASPGISRTYHPVLLASGVPHAIDIDALMTVKISS